MVDSLQHPRTNTGLQEKDNLSDLTLFNDKQRAELEKFLKDTLQGDIPKYKRDDLKPMEGWETPLLLIHTNEDGHFEIIKETKNKMEELEKSLVVIGIVGPYRQGKSALMNMIAGSDSQIGFGVDNTTDSKTKGIWIWCFKHPLRKDSCVVFMDSEGFGDIDKHNIKHDDNLFVLSVLLCSTLIYNSAGAINAEALDKLKIVGELADRITVRPRETKKEEDDEENCDEERLLSMFPMFVWVLRDFHLEIKGTPDGYLDRALKLKKGTGITAREYNVTRECIGRYFPERKCFALPNPLSGSSTASLKSVDKHLKFKEETARMCEYLMKNAEPKMVFQSEIRGKEFVGLAEQYAKKLSGGSQPCIVAACGQIVEKNNDKKLEEAKSFFDRKFLNTKEFYTSAELALEHLVEDNRYNVKYLLQLMDYMMKKGNLGSMLLGVKDMGRPVGPRGSSPEADLWQVFTNTLREQQVEHTKVVQNILDDQKQFMNVMMHQYLQQSQHLIKEHNIAEENGNGQQSAELMQSLLDLRKDFEKQKQDYANVVEDLKKIQGDKPTPKQGGCTLS